MNERRERALADLAWRAAHPLGQLLATAWHAGATNVNELADTARVARKTVYNQLAKAGIDPESRTEIQEQHMTAEQMKITINGITGGPYEKQRLDREERRSLPHLAPELVDRLNTWDVVAFHNDRLVPAVLDEREAFAAYQQVRRRADAAWEQLSAAFSWLAAHHEFIRRHHELKESHREWVNACDELDNIRMSRPHRYYDLVPTEQQIEARESARRHDIDTLVRERKTIAAETAKLATSS